MAGVGLGAHLEDGAPFYGGPPAPEDIPKIKAAILVHHGELDTRLAATWPDYDKALTEAHVPHEGYIYPGGVNAICRGRRAWAVPVFFMTHSWSTLSSEPRMSASKIHLTGIRSMDTVRAEIGTWISARPPSPTVQRWAPALFNVPPYINRGLITAESQYP